MTTLSRRVKRRNKFFVVIGLVAVWILLWGDLTWANVLGGLAVAAVVLIVFPLPPVVYAGTVRPLPLLRLAARFLSDLVRASLQIAVLALRFGHTPCSAVIAVPMRVHSDLNLTLTAEALSLVPGSLILEVDRTAGVLYIHVLGVADRQQIDDIRRGVYEVEARIVAALGTVAERQLVAVAPAAEVLASPTDRKGTP
jgi:multicomponent Na+:H+ antiporter subunit E